TRLDAGRGRTIREITDEDAARLVERSRGDERREQPIDAIGFLRDVLERDERSRRHAQPSRGGTSDQERQIAADERTTRRAWPPALEAGEVALASGLLQDAAQA